MDVPRLEHVRVNVSDFGRAVTWYEAILELTAPIDRTRTALNAFLASEAEAREEAAR